MPESRIGKRHCPTAASGDKLMANGQYWRIGAHGAAIRFAPIAADQRGADWAYQFLRF
jgi:hypothetical protein